MSTLDLYDTPCKFDKKQSTLKLWPFEPGARGSSYHIKTMNWF